MLLEAELNELRLFCAEVGSNLDWVQGPGGNASLKHDGSMWVKASGTWLARAMSEDVFVPVALQAVQTQIERADDTPVPVLGESRLRPSLETTLHGLMPQRYVLHTHSVAALSWATRRDARARLAELLDAELPWRWVPYAQPGAQLTAATRQALREGACDFLVLANHGVLLGADTLEALRGLLLRSEALLGRDIARARLSGGPACVLPPPDGYRLPLDPCVHALATSLIELAGEGALYPDHTVFLGPTPCFATPDNMHARALSHAAIFGEKPAFIIVQGVGVLVARAARPAVDAMLSCWVRVLSALAPGAKLAALSADDNAKLLNWEAEKYRQALEAQRS